MFNFHNSGYCHPAGQTDTHLKTDIEETVIHSPQCLTACWTRSRIKLRSFSPFSDK